MLYIRMVSQHPTLSLLHPVPRPPSPPPPSPGPPALPRPCALQAGTLVRYGMLNSKDASGASLADVLRSEAGVEDAGATVSALALPGEAVREYVELHIEQVGGAVAGFEYSNIRILFFFIFRIWYASMRSCTSSR